jgi:hypothetical protein
MTPQGQFFGDPVDTSVKHLALESEPCIELRNVASAGVIPIKGLRRFPQSDYVVAVTPSAAYSPESEFVTIPPSGSANLVVVLQK